MWGLGCIVGGFGFRVQGLRIASGVVVVEVASGVVVVVVASGVVVLVVASGVVVVVVASGVVVVVVASGVVVVVVVASGVVVLVVASGVVVEVVASGVVVGATVIGAVHSGSPPPPHATHPVPSALDMKPDLRGRERERSAWTGVRFAREVGFSNTASSTESNCTPFVHMFVGIGGCFGTVS